MSELHKRAQAHFARIRDELESIPVPEWDATVYYRPAISARERAAIWRHNDAREGWDQYAAILEAVLVRCLDESGARLFTDADRELLLDKYDPTILERIAVSMGTFIVEESDVDEKKS